MFKSIAGCYQYNMTARHSIRPKPTMPELLTIFLLTLGAGLAMSLGAFAARAEHIRPHWLEREVRHGVVAFGGGALLSAVVLVLVPDSLERVVPVLAVFCLLAGGGAFMALDVVLSQSEMPASQLAAMLSDFVPEALALGATFAQGTHGGAFLLAGLIALQNLPEGFNAYREMRSSGEDGGASGSARLLIAFLLLALLGPVAGGAGYLWLSEARGLVAAIMLFAAGGILYSMFEDIAPQAHVENEWAPPLGAVLGFVLGVAGHLLTTGGG